MAHELAYDKDGRAQALFVKQSAWHQQGTVLSEAPSYADAISIAGLDYPVEKVATYRKTAENGSYETTKAFVTVRTDNQEELGVVHGQYCVVQNVNAFRILTPLIDEGLATIETAGVLRKGADAWMLLQLQLSQMPGVVQEAMEGHKDKIKPYILVANNHSGRRGILTALTAIRPVCANTLGAAERADVPDQITVTHNDSAEQKLIDAAHTLWGDIGTRYERIAEAYELMRSDYLIPKEFQKLCVDVVAEDPRKAKGWNPEAKMAESVVSRYEAKKYTLNRLYECGAGQDGEPTSWNAYNAVVEALDHNTELWPTRAGVYRTASLLDGALREKKTKVFENLMDHARKNWRN
jgi:phage/plasmid-like protein (TIGR03299 family)